jgi:hypothetical protein
VKVISPAFLNALSDVYQLFQNAFAFFFVSWSVKSWGSIACGHIIGFHDVSFHFFHYNIQCLTA